MRQMGCRTEERPRVRRRSAGARPAARIATVMAFGLVSGQGSASAQPQLLLQEDFESSLEAWSFPLGQGHGVVTEPNDGNRVLRLQTVDEPVYALVAGSEEWGDVRIEGRVLFPDDDHNYLGFIYRYRDTGRRIDFGSLYIKGNGSYVQANEHHDTNVGRTLYPEIRRDLEGDRAIHIGAWQRFALEVVGPTAHLYVGDFSTPAVTMPASSSDTGLFGFKPRNPGAEVWIDDIRIEAIEGFSYEGPPVPDVPYARDGFVTDWHVLGPLPDHAPEIETAEDLDPRIPVRLGREMRRWRPYPADHRGAVLTGRVTEFRRARRVAYFLATVQAPHDTDAELWLSTTDDLAIWLDGTFVGYGGRQPYAWWDSGDNPEHAPLRAPVALREGPNDILIRVVGGTYATGGFYLRIAG